MDSYTGVRKQSDLSPDLVTVKKYSTTNVDYNRSRCKSRAETLRASNFLEKYPKMKYEADINSIVKLMSEGLQRAPKQLALLNQKNQNMINKSKLLRFVRSRQTLYKNVKIEEVKNQNVFKQV